MNFAIFSCTKNTKEETPLFKSCNKILKHSNVSFDLVFKENNTDGLSKCYNEFLNNSKQKYDIIVFIHDDVYLDDCFIFRKLLQLHKNYDIIGLAGGVNMQIKEPALWHIMCGGFGPNLRGVVSHFYNNAAIATTPFGPTPAPVDVIDGLFMSVNTKALVNKKWQFNENYNFHHYDISSCIDAKKAGLTIGVGPVWAIHQSPGLKSLSDSSFINSQNQFLKEYK